MYGIKVYNKKNGRRYGPYPREDDLWYLYESFREGNHTKKRFIGKGPLPKGVKGLIEGKDSLSNSSSITQVESPTQVQKDKRQLAESYQSTLLLVADKVKELEAVCKQGYTILNELLKPYGISVESPFEPKRNVSQ